MHRISHPLFSHPLHHQSVRSNHNWHTRSFAADIKIGITILFTNAQILHCRFDHAIWSITISYEQPFRKRAVVHTNSHRSSKLFASLNHWNERFLNARNFLLLLAFRISKFLSKNFNFLTPSSHINFLASTMPFEHKQSWIHSNFVNVLGGFNGNIHSLVMNICS